MIIKMIEELKEFGLTENEAIVYLALVELGASSATPIRNKVDLHMSRVYEALNSLIKKGMAAYFLRNGVRQFKAQDPEIMFNLIDEKKEKIAQVVPKIKLLAEKKEMGYNIAIYEGYKGFKQIYEITLSSLKQNDEILVLGAESESLHFLSTTFFREYTKRRISKKIKMRMICNYLAKDTAKAYSELPLTKVRMLPKNAVTPAAMNIYPGKVSILLLREKPVVFHIDCREVSESYTTYFEFLWNISNE